MDFHKVVVARGHVMLASAMFHFTNWGERISGDAWVTTPVFEASSDTYFTIPRNTSDALLAFRVVGIASTAIDVVWRFYGCFELPMTIRAGLWCLPLQDEVPLFPLSIRNHLHCIELKLCECSGSVEMIQGSLRDKSMVETFTATEHAYSLHRHIVRQVGGAGMIGFETFLHGVFEGCSMETWQNEKSCNVVTPDYRRLMLPAKNNAARKIQRAFRRAIACPDYNMCRGRLLKEHACFT